MMTPNRPAEPAATEPAPASEPTGPQPMQGPPARPDPDPAEHAGSAAAAPEDAAAASAGLLDQLQAQLNALRDAESARRSTDEELDHRAAEAARLEQTLQRQQAELDQREGELREELEQLEGARREHAQQRRSLEERSSRLDERLASLEEQAERIAAAARRAEHDAARAEERAAELDDQRRALEARAAELDARAAESDHAADAAESERLAELRAELDRERAARAERDEQIARRDERLAATEKNLQTVEAELSRTRDRLIEASEHLARPGADLSDEELALINTRRARLKRAKALLRERAADVDRAVAAVKAKAEEVSRREREAHEKLREAARATSIRRDAENLRIEAEQVKAAAEHVRTKYHARAARNRAGVFVCAALASYLLVAAASWMSVARVVQPPYQASATLAADAQGESSPSQVASWRGFVGSLPDDPQFLQKTAPRFRARGFEHLSSPADLREHLAARLEIQNPAPDQVTLRLTGEGAGPTTRALDTLAVAVVAYANETRALRADQASTRVAAAAAPDPTPLSDNRPRIFAVVFGVGLLLTTGVLFFAWRSLRSVVADAAKHRDADPLAFDGGGFGAVSDGPSMNRPPI